MDNSNEIPQTIQEHLGSPKTAIVLESINERAEIARIGTISKIIRALIMREIAPKEFVQKISDALKFNHELCLSVANEVKEKILKPIEYALLNYGIDVKEIDTSGAKTIEEIKKDNEMLLESIGIKIKKPITTISLENFSDTTPQDFTPVKINVDGSVDNAPKKIEVTDEPAPLVIHREKPQAPTQGGSQISGSSQQTKGFSLPFGFFKQKVVQTQVSSAPVKATVEFLKKDELKRAVDYSELRTPLTPFSKKEEGFIKTEEQKTQNNSQPVTQKINPLTMFGGAQTPNIQKTSVLPTQKIPTPNGSAPQPRSTSEQITNKGVLDIRTSVFDNKESRISNYNKEIIQTPGVLPEIKKQPIMDVQTPLSKSFPVPEKPKIPVINNPQKQNAPIEQKKEPTSPTSGKGFVWFKKPQTPNNNMEKTGPKVEGNTVDLRSNT